MFKAKKFKAFDSLRLINPLNAELNLISHLLELVGAHHIVHVSRIRVKRKLLSTD